MATIDSTMTPKSIVEEMVGTVPVPSKLTDGFVIMKVNTIGKMQKRVFTLSEDKFSLTITHSFKNETNSNTTFQNIITTPTTSLLRPMLRKVTSIGSNTLDTDSDSEKRIDIGSIERIQRGQSTFKFELARNKLDRSPRSFRKSTDTSLMMLLEPSRSFSIIFRGERTLDLMMQPEDDRDEILDALDRLIGAYQQAKVKASNDVLLLRYIWLDVDKDHSNTINEEELGNLLKQINFYVTRKELRERYYKFVRVIGLDKESRRKGLSFDQCVTFLHKVKRDTWQVKPVNSIWKELFGEYKATGEFRTTVSAGTFLQRFLHKKQGQYETNIDFVRRLFRKINALEVAHVASGGSSIGHDDFIDLNHFEAYLRSCENDAFDPRKEIFRLEEMTKPISHYWINSSHNTYLKGDQLQSTSSVEMYVNALYRGCRCVELDTHDGGDANDFNPIPVVYHGLRYQQVMAEILIKILDEDLYIPEEDDQLEYELDLPSPESLRGMVVIKGRRVAAHNLMDGKNGYDDDDTYWGSEDAYLDDESSDEEEDHNSDEVTNEPSESNISEIQPNHKVHPELSRITLFHGTSFKSWEDSINGPVNHMHSFSESKVNKIISRNQCHEWMQYNQTHMSRVYPGGIRLDSSNYNPVSAWSTGCQLVALNFQTPDAALRANDGRYRENANCGYVLKPEELLHQDFTISHTFDVPLLRMMIRVLSGSCLPKPKGDRKGECIDPYVQVTLNDLTDTNDMKMKTYYTTSVSSNGFFPIWNSEEFRFSVRNQSVAILQFTVWDKDVGSKDDFIASASIPMSCLRKGYRSVKLYDKSNTRSGAFDFASLLVEVKMEQTLTEV